jgi:hypothetical protein
MYFGVYIKQCVAYPLVGFFFKFCMQFCLQIQGIILIKILKQPIQPNIEVSAWKASSIRKIKSRLPFHFLKNRKDFQFVLKTTKW